MLSPVLPTPTRRRPRNQHHVAVSCGLTLDLTVFPLVCLFLPLTWRGWGFGTCPGRVTLPTNDFESAKTLYSLKRAHEPWHPCDLKVPDKINTIPFHEPACPFVLCGVPVPDQVRSHGRMRSLWPAGRWVRLSRRKYTRGQIGSHRRWRCGFNRRCFQPVTSFGSHFPGWDFRKFRRPSSPLEIFISVPRCGSYNIFKIALFYFQVQTGLSAADRRAQLGSPACARRARAGWEQVGGAPSGERSSPHFKLSESNWASFACSGSSVAFVLLP